MHRTGIKLESGTLSFYVLIAMQPPIAELILTCSPSRLPLRYLCSVFRYTL